MANTYLFKAVTEFDAFFTGYIEQLSSVTCDILYSTEGVSIFYRCDSSVLSFNHARLHNPQTGVTLGSFFRILGQANDNGLEWSIDSDKVSSIECVTDEWLQDDRNPDCFIFHLVSGEQLELRFHV